ncbi:MAG: hypothetical protein ABI042_00290 [Verrucomicrobiota bacterium]
MKLTKLLGWTLCGLVVFLATRTFKKSMADREKIFQNKLHEQDVEVFESEGGICQS